MCKEAIMRPSIRSADSQAREYPAIAGAEVGAIETGRLDGSDEAGELCLERVLRSARFFGCDRLKIRAVASSAETAQPGELVVYRTGQDCPARLVAEALARGAAGILTEQLLPCPLPQCIVGDVESTLAQITAHQLGRPDRGLLTIGVVGSAGKTTTSLLIASLLRSSGIRAAYQTDLGDSDGVVASTADQPVPGHAELVRWIDEARDSGSRAAVIELSESEVRHGAYQAIEFDLLVVTGSKTEQADYGESALQCALERLAAGGVVLAPADDPAAMRVVRDAGVRSLSYGIRQAADVTATMIEQADGATTLLISHDDLTSVMETRLCGAAMAANHAAAAAVGLLVGQPLTQITERLGRLHEVPGRGQRLSQPGHATVVLDEGGSPQRVAAAMQTQAAMRQVGRLWCVVAIDADDRPERLARYGNLAERFADQAIITCRPDSKRRFLAAAHGVLDGVEQCAAMRLVADHGRAVRWAIAAAEPNDTILVVGGFSAASPRRRRAAIEDLTRLVQGERARIEMAAADPSTTASKPAAATLKLYDPDR
jgi:UDP-N-acetylmuramoyl-L-alanyl-D-glutamate--2,6-diaminopimelate ligase